MRQLAPLLLLTTCLPGTAQVLPPPVAATPLARPLPDSVRRAVHQLFRRGRHFNALGGLSGLLVLAGGVSYVARGEGGT